MGWFDSSRIAKPRLLSVASMTRADTTKRSLDFSKGQRKPYTAKLKRPVRIRLDEFTVDYSNAMAAEA